jgi:general secretion pathway protein G
MMQRGLPRRSHGFTLIELVVTVAIVGLLATIAFPMIGLAERRSKEHELRESDKYKQAVDEGRIIETTKGTGYPPNLQTLVIGVVDAKSPSSSQKLYFLRRVPPDPFATDPLAAPDATWGLRSYASPPENPQPGADVFDVYSMARGVGLNGTPYKDW